MKTFHPESRENEHIYPEDYPRTVRIISLIQYLLLAILIYVGIILYRRKVRLSISYLASIILFTHLYSGITWTAHMVTLLFCFLPFILVEAGRLRPVPRAIYYFLLAVFIFLGIEGSDFPGINVYLFIRYYDVYTYLLLGLFLFSSWVVWSKRSIRIFPEGIQI